MILHLIENIRYL